MMKKLTLVLLCLVASISMLVAQSTRVSGVVLSAEDGEPVIGASIIVKGTTVGTVTDYDGNFTFEVPANSKTLQVSYIGMITQEVPVSSHVRIQLKSDTQNLDEVVVVAYGTVKKASFTGSASTMGTDDISSQKESLVKSLQGKMAGVRVGGSSGDPGSNQRILIRGISSYSASDQPLYVVDGVAITDDVANLSSGLKSQSVLSSLNPDDIESLTVLKDAAAASLYGSRAANGVIIITTKQGKAGKTKVSYNMETGWTNIAVGSQYHPMSAKDMKDYYWHGIKNYYVSRGNSEADAAALSDRDTPSFFWNYDSNNNTNWRDEVYKNGLITDHQVAISGGNDKTKFYTGLGYNKTKGIVKGSEFERYSGRLNLDHYAKDWLRIGVRQMLAFTSTQGYRDQNDQAQGFSTSAPLSILYTMDPTAVNKLEDGSYNPNASLNSNISNPNLMLGQTEGGRAETINSDMLRSLTNLEAEVTLPYGFSAKTILGYDFIDNKEREFWASESVNGAALGGLGYRTNFTNKTLTSSTTLNYNQSFDKHNVRALVGYEVEERDLLYVSLSADKYSTDKLPELVNGQPRGASSSTYAANIMSYLGNVNYDFDNKYYVSGSFRRDGSSRLGADNRWANFWSVSAAWRLTQEAFFTDMNNDLFTDLKLRLSYGTNGNLPTGFYSNLATYSFSGGYGDESAIFWGNAGNSKLGWEKSKNFNVGLDWTLYNRVTLSVEYYNKMTTDLLFNVPTSIVTGFDNNIQNLGKLKNQGVEITVSSTNILTKDFAWTTDFNLSFQSSKINKLPDGNDVMYGDGNMYLLREGESMHTFNLPQWLGVNSETGLGEFYIDPSLNSRDAADGTKDGNVTNYYAQASPTVVGKALPDMIGGITNTFRYKDFDLSFMLSFQSGASMFDYTGYFLTYSDGVRIGSFNMNKEVAGDYWTQPGDQVSHPKPIYGNPYRSDRFSSRTIRSTDNVRMRDITFGYTLPISKQYVNNLRVYFKTSNPFMLYCATDNIDPDVDINGYRQTDTPLTKSFMFGLNFEF